ncbi:MAG: hypothetical protein DRJ38_08690 [Thermoprotei archaeon]|nr:MAG: hypothetical protein DRJ38_08690 [Thermoprotei archaeon]
MQLCNLTCSVWQKILCYIKSCRFDAQYVPFTLREVEDFIDWWVSEVLPNAKYLPELFDCDDFASLFRALMVKHTGKNAVFFVAGMLYYGDEFLGLHAWVAVITTKGVYFIEPQTGDMFPAGCHAESHDGFYYDALFFIG